MRLCPACGEPLGGAGWRCPACRFEPDGAIPELAPALDRADASPDVAAYRELARAEDRSFWFRARNRLVVSTLRRYCAHASSLFEVGCGAGYVLSGIAQAFPGMRLVGGDPFPPALELAHERVPAAELLQLDGRGIPFVDEFDVTCGFDIIEHVDDDAAVVEGLARAVRPGGTVIITVPQHRWLWSHADEHFLHLRRYRRGEVHALLSRAGLEILRTTSFVSVLLPAMVLSRLRRVQLADYDPSHEYFPGPRLNAMLEYTLGAERRLIERGVSFPAGGSLLVVSHKPVASST